MKQSIQIIGGIYRGKKISFPDSIDLRPTPNRIRETLFNWLMQDIRGACCLDAFAGSGALGFEAFSRGASHVTFVEQTPLVQTHLQHLINQFASPKLNLVKNDALMYLKNTKEQYNIIFLDPPFSQNLIPQCLQAIKDNKVLQPDGLVYIESAEAITIDQNQWQQLKLKRAGQVAYSLLRNIESS